MMKNFRLISRAFEVDQQLVLNTPQVEAAIVQIITVLQSDPYSVVYLSGLSGSGLSTALTEALKRLYHVNDAHRFMLARPEIDDGYLPSEYLLHYFGFRFIANSKSPQYSKGLSKEAISLGGILTGSIIFVDDYLAGVANLAQKRTHLRQWNQLAEAPLSLRIVLSGPSDYIKSTWESHQVSDRTILIQEWAFDENFLKYLNGISSLIYKLYEIDVDLPLYASSLFSLSQGNTARLLDYIRECVRYAIFSAEKGFPTKLLKMTFREVLHTNAKLFHHLACS